MRLLVLNVQLQNHTDCVRHETVPICLKNKAIFLSVSAMPVNVS